VVMRVTVLKAAPGGVGAIVEYLAGPGRAPAGASAAVDYYDDPGEPPGRWWGSGCAAVGLAGEVDPDDLARMLDAAHPGTGRQLGRGYSACSARGFDATFSAPKSVSLLWALTGDEAVRAEVLAAHDTAVEAALGWLETHGCVTRRGTDGVDQVDAGGLCVALFRQHTSRALDPQLHTHGRDARRPPSLPRDHRGRSRCLRVRLGLRGPPHLQRVAPAVGRRHRRGRAARGVRLPRPAPGQRHRPRRRRRRRPHRPSPPRPLRRAPDPRGLRPRHHRGRPGGGRDRGAPLPAPSGRRERSEPRDLAGSPRDRRLRLRRQTSAAGR
jgi:hypothetical protein